MRRDNQRSLEAREPVVKLRYERQGWHNGSEGARELLDIGGETLRALCAHRLLERVISRESRHVLRFRIPGSDHSFTVSFRRLVPLALGKAAPWMGSAFCQIAEGTFNGVGVCSTGAACVESPGWTWLHGDHPLPKARSSHAGRIVAQRVGSAAPDDLVILLLSGGASSLAMLPKEGVSAYDLAALIERLLQAGASIHELNAVRRRLDLLKGGGLARLAAPARVVSLIISDVPGNRLIDIGSGPTAGSHGDEPDPCDVLARANLVNDTTPRIKELLQSSGASWPFPRPMNIVIGSNETALSAAAEAARDFGYRPVVHPQSLSGEARIMGQRLAELTTRLLPVHEKTCLLFGGETVVTVAGRGEGGRNLELALSFALNTPKGRGVRLLALATDGKDGSSPAAGAIITDTILQHGSFSDEAAERSLEMNDSYHYLEGLRAAIHTGPTGTNVADMVCILLDPH